MKTNNSQLQLQTNKIRSNMKMKRIETKTQQHLDKFKKKKKGKKMMTIFLVN